MGGFFGILSAVESNGAAEVVRYHLTQEDVENVFTAVANLTALEWFSFLAQLILIGVCLMVVFVIAFRRF